MASFAETGERNPAIGQFKIFDVIFPGQKRIQGHGDDPYCEKPMTKYFDQLISFFIFFGPLFYAYVSNIRRHVRPSGLVNLGQVGAAYDFAELAWRYVSLSVNCAAIDRGIWRHFKFRTTGV